MVIETRDGRHPHPVGAVENPDATLTGPPRPPWGSCSVYSGSPTPKPVESPTRATPPFSTGSPHTQTPARRRREARSTAPKERGCCVDSAAGMTVAPPGHAGLPLLAEADA